MKIEIISHRGYWKDAVEKNQRSAFIRSFSSGFGTETDVRDLGGELVISHDPPVPGAMSIKTFLEIYCAYDNNLPLALNIKSDGLCDQLKTVLAQFNVDKYFVFDMSVPDMLHYINRDMNVFGRQSEYELAPPAKEEITGVWLDAFHGDWLDERCVRDHLDEGRQVCVVSPELHKRPHGELWKRIKGWATAIDGSMMLCTDLPSEARAFFND